MAWGEAMPLRPGVEGQDTNLWTMVLHDPGGKLTLEQVRQEPYKSRFKPFKRGRTHMGAARGAWWLRLEVRNATDKPQEWLLQATHPQFDQAEMFCFPVSGKATVRHLGDHVPFDKRPIAHQTNIFPLRMAPNQVCRIYVRLAYEDAGIADLRLRVWSPPQFFHHDVVQLAMTALLVGGFLMIALFNLVIAFSTRAQEYFWYVLYVLSMAITSLAYQGLGYRFLWHGWNWFTDNAPVVFPFFGLVLAAQFTRSFLKLRQTMPRVDKALLVYIGLTLLLLCLLFVGFRREVIFISTCISSVSLIYPFLGLTLWLRGRREARFYTMAWTVWVMAISLVIMRYLGLIRLDLLTNTMPSVLLMIEALLLSMALADRINILRQQKEVAEKSYLEALKRDKLELERQVRERTAEIERMHKRALKAARTDVLTGLPNRRAFYNDAGREMDRAGRYGRPVSVIMLDIDHFKRINDTYGHVAGDEVLRHLAGILGQEKRSHDLVGRLGGEEFALLLPEASQEEAVSLAQRIRKTITAQPAVYNGEAINFSASFGVARQKMADSLEIILDRADDALYTAKEAGRDRVEVA